VLWADTRKEKVNNYSDNEELNWRKMARLPHLLAIVLTCVHHVSAATDFSVETSNLSTWNQSDWSLTTNTYLPGQYQSRLSLANGYVVP
jgi:hypothetical protein